MTPRSAFAQACRSATLGIGLLVFGAPAVASTDSHAKLVNCGETTCLRLSGYRADPAMVVRVAGNPIDADGQRSWHAIIPLSTARDGANASLDKLTITLTDGRTGLESTSSVILPPGVLGKRIELATLEVRAP